MSARAANGDRIKDRDREETIDEIALSSLDGQQWNDARGKPIESARIRGCVTRVVIGRLKAKTPITMSDAIRERLREHWPTITHLHLWSIDALTALPGLPPGLKCLDLRGCEKIESLPELPDTLETLDLEGCAALKKLPVGRTPEMRFLHLDGCTSLGADEINEKIGVCSKLEELTLSRCVQLENLAGLEKLAANEGAPLRKLVLKDCGSLACLPSLGGLRKLQHLNLHGCSALPVLPPIPDALQYLILSGCTQLIEFEGQGIDVRDRREREDGDENEDADEDDGENVARWFHVRRKYGGELAFSARAKLLLLGDGRAGKTTLAKRLIWNSLSEEAQRAPENRTMRPVKGESFTHKIQFFQWRCPVEVPEKIAKRIDRLAAEGVDVHGAEEIFGKRATARIGVWDFGGQEIYHRTHRMFTSAGNVFLIVWREELADEEIFESCPSDMTQEEWLELNRQRPLDYWLQYVRDENPDARLAMVCTHVPTGVSKPPWISRLVDRSLRKPKPSGYFVDSLEDDPETNGEVEETQDWLEQNLSEQVKENGLITPLFFERVADRVDEMLSENDMARRKGRTPVHLMLDWPSWCRQIEAIHAKLGMGVALQEEDIEEITMHLHRTGTVFLLDRIDDKQVIIDQSWACGIMYEVLRPGGDLRARIKRNGGWFEEHDLSLSPVWDRLEAALRARMLEVMEQCALIVRVDGWARGPEMPRTIFLANEKWLLPDFEDVLDRLDTAKVRIGSRLKSRKLGFKRASLDEFRAHRLMAELCQRFGRNTIWFRSGLQIIDDRAVPSWFLRLRWVADDERVGYSGTVDAQLFARDDVLEEVSDEFYSLFLQIGFDLEPRRDQESEVPHRLHEARNYFRLIQREAADVGISARGGDAERVELFLNALRDEGVEDIKWYRDGEHQKEIRKAGVSHYMKNILGKSRVQVLFFSDRYLEDRDGNLHCPWELAKAINEWNSNQLARERVITIWLPREEFDLGEIAVRIKQIFERLSRKFLDRYNESDSSRDLDDHLHFRNALRHVDGFLDARASWRGFFFTLDDLGGDPANSAVVQEVVSLLEQ